MIGPGSIYQSETRGERANFPQTPPALSPSHFPSIGKLRKSVIWIMAQAKFYAEPWKKTPKPRMSLAVITYVRDLRGLPRGDLSLLGTRKIYLREHSYPLSMLGAILLGTDYLPVH